MKVYVILLLCLFGSIQHAQAGGRALPIESQDYATSRFRENNYNMKWDRSNFLVDLSGTWAICETQELGVFRVNERTRNGLPILGIRDFGRTSGNDVNAVHGDVTAMVDSFKNNPQYANVINSGKTFGCSVRPGCQQGAVLVCLFEDAKESPYPPPPPPPPPPGPGRKYGKAFTREQYDKAQSMMNMEWDRSNYLENVVGSEMSCDMMGTRGYNLNSVIDKVRREKGLDVKGYTGYARNIDATEPAMMQILKSFKGRGWHRSGKLGCAVIPDCIGAYGTMNVVVACLLEETYLWK